MYGCALAPAWQRDNSVRGYPLQRVNRGSPIGPARDQTIIANGFAVNRHRPVVHRGCDKYPTTPIQCVGFVIAVYANTPPVFAAGFPSALAVDQAGAAGNQTAIVPQNIRWAETI